jgi:excinuclease ABC subunit A
VLLHGSGDEDIEFVYSAESAGARGKSRSVKKRHPFEGIIPNWERRYRETDSAAVREDLARYQAAKPCPDCGGSRLRREARHVFLLPTRARRRRPRAAAVRARSTGPWRAAADWFDTLELEGAKAEIADKVVREIRSRLRFLNDVGLTYLSLDRGADTLSGGEAQRIRLASQIGSGLSGVMYVLDEPSIGLHQRDNARLIGTLRHLRDLGNSVLVVEHDEDMILAADHVVDMGPGAGVHGGRVIAQGTPEARWRASAESLTGRYLAGTLRIECRAAGPADDARHADGAHRRRARQQPAGPGRRVPGRAADLRHRRFRLGQEHTRQRHAVRGVARRLYGSHAEPAAHERIEGLEAFDKVINVDQSPIGRTPRSNPATYTGLFTPIRELFAEVPAARERGYGAGRFSFNVAGGRCEACQGDGVIKVEMHFLPDVYVPCDTCHGKRYNRETLEILYRGRNIAQVLEMTIEDAHAFFARCPTSRASCRPCSTSAWVMCAWARARPRCRVARRSA